MPIKSLYLFTFIVVFTLKISFGLNIPETIDVRIFSGINISEFTFMPTKGRYLICDQNHNKLTEISPLTSLTIKRTQKGFVILQNDSVIFSGNNIVLQGGSFQNSFLITPSGNHLPARIYDGDIRIRHDNNQLNIINAVSLESYVAGTVQSESGFNRHAEFYKVQAIIIRTYALNNLRRHQREGFHVCDLVHCQAYHGKTINPDIVRAVEHTRGQVVVDNRSALINTVYHANCGGQTVNSEDLWPHAMDYLRSRIDTFCLTMPGARWEKSISMGELRNFLSQKHRFQPNESQWRQIKELKQNSRIHHLDAQQEVHLRHVRDHFGLRSTFFSVQEQNDTLFLSGRGYGHGVGLCQEGAMKRAEHGHSLKEILGFYYQNSRILTLEPEVVF